jgi:hypothetical protein
VKHSSEGSLLGTVNGAISRKASVTCKIIENTLPRVMLQFMRKMVLDKVDLLVTDSRLIFKCSGWHIRIGRSIIKLANMSGA